MDLRGLLAIIVTLFILPAQGSELDPAYVKLFKTQVAMAKTGAPGDVYNLAKMYEQGLGTNQDLGKARDLYSKAAEKGELRAKRKLRIWERAEKQAEKEVKTKPPIKTAQASKVKKSPAKKKLTEEQKKAAWKKAMAAALKRAEAGDEESDVGW